MFILISAARGIEEGAGSSRGPWQIGAKSGLRIAPCWRADYEEVERVAYKQALRRGAIPARVLA